MPLKWKVAIGVIGVTGILGFLFREKIGTVVASLKERNRLAALLPQVAAAVAALRARLESMGIRTHVGRTFATDAEQVDIVESGKSSTNNSWHELRRAIDLYPYGPDGKPDLDGRYLDRFRTMHTEAVKFGFTGIAFNPDGSKKFITVNKGKPNEKKIWDGAHLQYTEGMTFAQAERKHNAS